MYLSVVAMVKNESDVIDSFCRHLLALFDRVVIVDHRSTDGTLEYLRDLAAKLPKLVIYSFEEEGYFQSELMTSMVQRPEVMGPADWVFLLDADEILPFKSREEFESKLSACALFPIIRMPWFNLVPVEYGDQGLFGRRYLLPPCQALHYKIAYQPALLPVNDFVIAQGNHAVLAGKKAGALPDVPGFPVYHVPIRSKEQASLKLLQGVLSYINMGNKRIKGQGNHWFDMADHIKSKGLDEAVMNGLVVHYGAELAAKDVPVEAATLRNGGYEEIVLDFARIERQEIPLRSPCFSEKVISALVSCVSGDSVGSSKNHDEISIRSDGSIVFSMAGKEERVETQAVNEKAPVIVDPVFAEMNDTELLTHFLRPTEWRIETLTPTAWGGHIPFMFCLVSMLRPRLFVELGSHYGASFFAACQAMKACGLDSKSVAIDLWMGDDHTGAYGEEVFDNFSYLLQQRYSDVGTAMRQDFNEAVHEFQDGSIDLLHIDGLHTYEAVKNDFDTWKGKVSEDGVIIFHDTNVYDRDFEVYRLWSEIEGDYPSFEFKHTHGLGVISLSKDPMNPIVRLLNMAKADEGVASFLEGHFSRLGELSTFEALTMLQKQAQQAQQEQQAPRKKGVMKKLFGWLHA